jgi:hypothetical protein
MEIVFGALVVLVGVMYGLHSHAGSEIGERPMKDELPDAGDPFDSWGRGTR